MPVFSVVPTHSAGPNRRGIPFSISKVLADIIKKLPEAGIRTDKNDVLQTVQSTILDDEEVVVSLDIVSLFTNVPLQESIDYTVDLLYSTPHSPPGINRETFKELLEMVSKDVIMLTHRGYYRQVDGVAMGSSVGPLLANIFVSRYDSELASFSKFYFRYVDDVIRTLRKGGEKYLLDLANTMHENLKFTLERPDNKNGIVFLDMQIRRDDDGRLAAQWYRKETDTGVLLNFHSLSPNLYKRSLVAGMVHLIMMTTSTWTRFSESLREAHQILRNNQYPQHFIERITNLTLEKIITANNAVRRKNIKTSPTKTSTPALCTMMPIEYRGKVSEDFKQKLDKLLPGSLFYFVSIKMRSKICHLKTQIPPSFKSRVIYQIQCPACAGTYIGQTVRHLSTRLKEHGMKNAPVNLHFHSCKQTLTEDDAVILDSHQDPTTLLSLEAVYIKRKKPILNTKDEFKSHTLQYAF